MNSFRVWERTTNSASHIFVEGEENAEWLLSRLSRNFNFKSSESLREEVGSTLWSFHVQYTSQLTRLAFSRLLAGMPNVRFVTEPA